MVFGQIDIRPKRHSAKSSRAEIIGMLHLWSQLLGKKNQQLFAGGGGEMRGRVERRRQCGQIKIAKSL